MSRRVTVVSPGFGEAILDWLASTNHSKLWLLNATGMSSATLYPLFRRDRAPALQFDRIAQMIPTPWTRGWCELTERPAMPKRQAPEPRERDYSFRCIKTPSLDAFAGLPGGWL